MNLITTSLEAVNLALTHLGQKKLAALDTTTENGRKMSTYYAPARQSVLRDIRPNFAKKDTILHHTVLSEKTITGATQADPCVITSASHGLSADQIIAIWDVVGMTDLNGKRYVITSVTTHTITIEDENGNPIDATEFDAYVSGGKLGVVAADPLVRYAYRYTPPTDYIMMAEINGNEAADIDHEFKSGEIYSDESEMECTYIFDETTLANWDVDSVMLLSYKLAALAALAVTNLTKVADIWETKYDKEKGNAKGAKSQESGTRSGPPRKAIVDDWTRSRTGS